MSNMRIGDFMQRTGLSLKTARWLFDLWHPGFTGSQRVFTEEEVDWVLARQPKNFSEELKQVPEFPDYYVTRQGIVYFYRRGFLEELKGDITNGYHYVRLNNIKGSERIKVARLVALLYIPNPDNKPTVNHIDGNKLNDTVVNLEWATVAENTQHAYNTGLAENDKGFDDSQSMPVMHITLDKKLINVYGSITIAANMLGLYKTKVARAARVNTPRLLNNEELRSHSNTTFVYYTNETQQQIIK